MKFRKLEKDLLVVGARLPFTIYIQLNATKCLPLINKEEMVCEDDLDRVAKYPESLLLIETTDYINFIEGKVLCDLICEFQAGGTINHNDGVKVVNMVLEKEEGISQSEYFTNVMKKSSEVVMRFFESEESKKDPKSVYSFFKNLQDSKRPIESHSMQLSSLGCLFLLGIEGCVAENLREFTNMASLHGYGMDFVNGFKEKTPFSTLIGPMNLKVDIARDQAQSQKICENHIHGGDLRNLDEASIYLKHLYVAEKALESSKNAKESGMKKALKDFKALNTPKELQVNNDHTNPYIVSKVFYIIDNLVGELNTQLKKNPDTTEGNLFMSGLQSLKNKKTYDGHAYNFDESLIDAMIAQVF